MLNLWVLLIIILAIHLGCKQARVMLDLFTVLIVGVTLYQLWRERKNK